MSYNSVLSFLYKQRVVPFRNNASALTISTRIICSCKSWRNPISRRYFSFQRDFERSSLWNGIWAESRRCFFPRQFHRHFKVCIVARFLSTWRAIKWGVRHARKKLYTHCTRIHRPQPIFQLSQSDAWSFPDAKKVSHNYCYAPKTYACGYRSCSRRHVSTRAFADIIID